MGPKYLERSARYRASCGHEVLQANNYAIPTVHIRRREVYTAWIRQVSKVCRLDLSDGRANIEIDRGRLGVHEDKV